MPGGPPGSKFFGNKKDRRSPGVAETIRGWLGVKS